MWANGVRVCMRLAVAQRADAHRPEWVGGRSAPLARRFAGRWFVTTALAYIATRPARLLCRPCRVAGCDHHDGRDDQAVVAARRQPAAHPARPHGQRERCEPVGRRATARVRLQRRRATVGRGQRRRGAAVRVSGCGQLCLRAFCAVGRVSRRRRSRRCGVVVASHEQRASARPGSCMRSSACGGRCRRPVSPRFCS